MAAPVARRLFTVTDYHRMAEAGILTEDDRVELIEGEIVQMTAIGAPHAACVNALTELVMEQVGRRARVSVQNPVGLSDISEPEPDISVLRRRDYRKALPAPADVYLLIEVADSSLAHDRGTKFPLYARNGIPEAFLVDLNGETIERHSEPRDGRYHRIEVAGRGETLASTVLLEVVLPVDVVLGYELLG